MGCRAPSRQPRQLLVSLQMALRKGNLATKVQLDRQRALDREELLKTATGAAVLSKRKYVGCVKSLTWMGMGRSVFCMCTSSRSVLTRVYACISSNKAQIMRASREASNSLRGASQMLAQQIKSSLETTKVLGMWACGVAVRPMLPTPKLGTGHMIVYILLLSRPEKGSQTQRSVAERQSRA